jgi:hypothetical protein
VTWCGGGPRGAGHAVGRGHPPTYLNGGHYIREPSSGERLACLIPAGPRPRELVPVLEWILREEPHVGGQVAAARALCAMAGVPANHVIASLVAQSALLARVGPPRGSRGKAETPTWMLDGNSGGANASGRSSNLGENVSPGKLKHTARSVARARCGRPAGSTMGP